ncbi:hypothetical protein SAMN06296273_0109 [Nitrosomonas ureae]|uniref:Uncharacterized protein n=1 Tax=Nitrosomonas ureae TaxID=44577 RepID=A0A285BU80_9PROT|nr:hypothetical protein [Nitrosomonas ureae]SNX58645.1 hypothetical protein SAMN06296273_0109 [Nitrosomonas ureae]
MNEEQKDAGVTTDESHSIRLRAVISWIVVIILICFGAFMLYKLTNFHNTPGDYWKIMVKEQFPVLVGLPMAGLGSLFVTLILRISTGPIEFEIGGLKFKGGAAPIVFWIICFMVIVLSINLLWQN